MDMHAAYREVGTYRAAAEICGTTPKTVKRSVLAARGGRKGREPRRRAQLRRRQRPRRRTGGADQGANLGQAAAAHRPSGRLHRLGPQLPPARRRGEGAVAGEAPPGPAPGHLGARRHVGLRLGRDRPAVRLLRRDGLEQGALRLLRRQPRGRGDHDRAGAVLRVPGRGAQDGVDRPHGVPQGRHRRRARHPDAGLRALRHPLRVPARLLPRSRSGVQGAGREPRRLREVRSHDPRRAQRRRPGRGERQGPGLVRRGQRRGAQRDLRHPRRAVGQRARGDGDAAVSAGDHRQAGGAQGRPAQLRALRLGPLLGAHRPHRAPGRARGPRRQGPDRLLGRDHRHPRPRRPW